jgi:hypothetical protein
MPAGRPTKCTPELTEEFAKLLRAGNYFECACGYCGITMKTGYNWLNWGEEALEAADGIEEDVPEGNQRAYAHFFHTTQVAAHSAEIRNVALIQQAAQGGGEGDWRAAAWWLEKRYQKRWGMKTEQHELTGANGAPLFAVVKLGDDDAGGGLEDAPDS